MRHKSSRQIERRYERALAALQAIARIMGNVVFRVEDYRRPYVTERSAGDEKREKSENPDAKRAGGDR